MSTITTIPLSPEALEAPYISHTLLEILGENIRFQKKTLLFYNRRGTARAWICEDCGHFEKCPHCDIAFAYHTSPIKRLVCHQCNTVAPFPIECSHCHGQNIAPVGVGIERIATDLQRILGESVRILRIDSDSRLKVREMYDRIGESDIILATSLGSTIVHPDIAGVVFLSFEVNLSVPEYDIEEQIFDEILFYKKQNISLFLQTYIPEHPLIQEILAGNQKSFFASLQQERQTFRYPPYADLATLRVQHSSKDQVRSMVMHITGKLQPLLNPDVFLAVDSDLWEKRGGDWMQKIVLKGKNIAPILRELEIEVVRNRSVSLEWN